MTEKEEKVRIERNREDILQRAEKNGRWDGIDLKVEERGMWLIYGMENERSMRKRNLIENRTKK